MTHKSPERGPTYRAHGTEHVNAPTQAKRNGPTRVLGCHNHLVAPCTRQQRLRIGHIGHKARIMQKASSSCALACCEVQALSGRSTLATVVVARGHPSACGTVIRGRAADGLGEKGHVWPQRRYHTNETILPHPHAAIGAGSNEIENDCGIASARVRWMGTADVGASLHAHSANTHRCGDHMQSSPDRDSHSRPSGP
jgi:hypothetical protein